jgi:hypothetical protein
VRRGEKPSHLDLRCFEISGTQSKKQCIIRIEEIRCSNINDEMAFHEVRLTSLDLGILPGEYCAGDGEFSIVRAEFQIIHHTKSFLPNILAPQSICLSPDATTSVMDSMNLFYSPDL